MEFLGPLDLKDKQFVPIGTVRVFAHAGAQLALFVGVFKRELAVRVAVRISRRQNVVGREHKNRQRALQPGIDAHNAPLFSRALQQRRLRLGPHHGLLSHQRLLDKAQTRFVSLIK